MPVVVALTVVGVALRLAVARQSLFADELSTHFVIAGRGLAEVVSVVHTDAEITPPLYFVASWLTTRIELTPELLRAPSLLAGAAAIPLVYRLGLRTVGRPAALVAAALTTFSPFMVYYSAEARGYELMIALVLGSTLCLLAAVERGRLGWWAAYAVCTCAAVYTHYTSVFALAGQLGWLVWAHPEACGRAFVATGAAVAGFLPWVSGLRGDLASPTTQILSALQPFDAPYVRSSLVHWAIGFPYQTPTTRIADLPGIPALLALVVAVALGLAGLAGAGPGGRLPRPGRRVVLVIVLAVSVPVGETLASLLGSNLLGTRNLAASWPAFALCLAGVLVAARPRARPVAVGLAVAAFAAGGVALLGGGFSKPAYDAAVAFIDDRADRGQVVVDGVSLSPAGVPTVLDLTLARRRPVFALNRPEVRYDPFRILAPAPPIADVVRRAVAAAAGGPLVLVVPPDGPTTAAALGALPSGYRSVARRTYDGVNRITVLVLERQTAIGA